MRSAGKSPRSRDAADGNSALVTGQPKSPCAAKASAKPAQNTGADDKTCVKGAMTRRKGPELRTTPNGPPNRTAISDPRKIRERVTGARSEISWATGKPLMALMPGSSRATATRRPAHDVKKAKKDAPRPATEIAETAVDRISAPKSSSANRPPSRSTNRPITHTPPILMKLYQPSPPD